MPFHASQEAAQREVDRLTETLEVLLNVRDEAERNGAQ